MLPLQMLYFEDLSVGMKNRPCRLGNDWHRIPLKRRKRKANDQHNNNVAGFIPGDIGPGVFGKDTKR
jgi:hypothetical protein